jgi:hypothetical protein
MAVAAADFELPFKTASEQSYSTASEQRKNSDSELRYQLSEKPSSCCPEERKQPLEKILLVAVHQNRYTLPSVYFFRTTLISN